ncbi:MAG: hypothetical protein U0451_02680 [Candidatus Saccharimonadales bacterium]
MQKATAASVARGAEVPFIFGFEPNNMARSVTMSKVNPITGEVIPDSGIQVGLVGGLTDDGHPTAPFTQEDLTRAMGGYHCSRSHQDSRKINSERTHLIKLNQSEVQPE